MLRRFALVIVPLLLAGLAGTAHAEDHGAVVVAESDASTPAARALAREVYKDEALRPAVDELTARVLAGDAAPEGATAAVKEIADVRASLAAATSEAVKKRLVASLGASAHAAFVIDVTLEGDRPIAKVLRVGTAAFEGAPIAGAVAESATGERTITWAGATTSLRALISAGSASGPSVATPPLVATPKPEAAPGPLKPEKPTPRTPVDVPTVSPSMLKSPWFWASVGVVLTAGVTVFVLSKTGGDGSGNFHVTGQVPR